MTPIEFLQQYYWIIIIAYAAGFIGVLIYFLSKNRGKILVTIIKPGLPEQEIWKKPTINGDQTTIVMSEGTKKNPGWQFSFDTTSLILKKSLMRTYFMLFVKPDAERAISWKSQLLDGEQPSLSKKEVEQYAKTKVFKIRYDTKEQGPSSTAILVLGVLIVGTLILGILNFLSSRGIRI